MTNARFNSALDFAEEFGRSQTSEDATERLAGLATDFGFTSFVLATFTGRGSFTDPCILASGWNPEWQERYLGNQYVVDDPVVARGARGSTPFLWSDTRNDPGVTRRGLRILEEARSFRMNNGVFIPVYGPAGCEGSLTFGGDEANLGPSDMQALHLAAIYAYGHCAALTAGGDADTTSDDVLTNRELECLKWSAAGKTSSEIADRLGISRHTADWYLKEATIKLGAGNRTHAVAEAFRRGIIN